MALTTDEWYKFEIGVKNYKEGPTIINHAAT
jgi:hypothetical protein